MADRMLMVKSFRFVPHTKVPGLGGVQLKLSNGTEPVISMTVQEIDQLCALLQQLRAVVVAAEPKVTAAIAPPPSSVQ